MVGWGKAGKTTLVKRLAGEPMDPNEPETHGIMIRPLTLHCTDMESFGRGCGTLAGSTRCTSFFLTTRSLYLLVLEQRSDRVRRTRNTGSSSSAATPARRRWSWR